jgi:hypothetical protein
LVDDEDNLLRVYDADRGGPPLRTFDLSSELPFAKGHGTEADLEGATRLGDAVYVLASHARRRSGKLDTARHLFFAASLPIEGAPVGLVGKPYTALLEDMLRAPEFADLGLDSAAARGPASPGGLNLEGLTAAQDDSLLMGFRNPVPGGKALLTRLTNPRDVVRGARARFTVPLRVDLGGLGVTALSSWRGSYLVLAGPIKERKPFRLYRFHDVEPPRAVEGVSFDGFFPEGFFTPEARDEIMVLSDDGMVQVGGRACKKLETPEHKGFRGIWLRLPPG